MVWVETTPWCQRLVFATGHQRPCSFSYTSGTRRIQKTAHTVQQQTMHDGMSLTTCFSTKTMYQGSPADRHLGTEHRQPPASGLNTDRFPILRGSQKHTTILLVHNSACLKHCNCLKQQWTETNGCSHETLHHSGLQSSHRNTCAEHLCLAGSTNSCPTMLI